MPREIVLSSVDAAGGRRRSWVPVVAGTGLAAGLVAAAFTVGGPLGYRFGLWSLATVFRPLWPVGLDLGIAGAGLSILGLMLSALGGRRGWAVIALIGIIGGGIAAYVPWRFANNHAPGINDITTDTENPPAFEAILPIREAAKAEPVTYGGPEIARQQKAAYPEIVPLHLDVAPTIAFDRALAVARSRGWIIVAGDIEHGRIEASDRTRWFGFTDDIVIRVTPDGAGSRIDIRSKSRIGTGDKGENAARIDAYLAALKSAS